MSKAQRTVIQLGTLEVEGFMLPDGSYAMSQAGAAEAVGEDRVYALRFLRSKEAIAFLGEGYTGYTPESIEVESSGSGRGQTRINALPIAVVSAYWLARAVKGNRKALTLSWALVQESLDRRFDAAFGVTRTESEYNERLTARVQELESTIRELNDGWASTEITREEIRILRDYIRDHGLPGPFENLIDPL